MSQWLDDWTSNLLCAHSNHRLLSAYAGDCCLIDYDGEDWPIGWASDWRDDAEILDVLSTGPNDPGSVKTWYDQSGNDRYVTQSNGGLQPASAPDENSVYTITGDAVGAVARPAIYFASDYLTRTISQSAAELTISVVVQRTAPATPSYGPIVCLSATTTSGFYSLIATDYSNPDAFGFAPANLNNMAGATGTKFATANPEVLTARYKADGTCAFFRRGICIAESVNSYTPNFTTLTFGYFSSSYFVGKLSECVIWTTPHTDEDILTIANAQAATWGIKPVVTGGGSGGGRRPRMQVY